MQHLDPDRLVLLALAEEPGSISPGSIPPGTVSPGAISSGMLPPGMLPSGGVSPGMLSPGETEHLDGCSDCRAELRALSQVARAGAESNGMRDLPPPPERVWDGIQTELARRTVPSAASAPPARTVTPRRRRRWAVPVLAAAVTAVLAVAGTLTVQSLTPGTPEVTARATLEPLPSGPASARGDVQVRSDGDMVVDVTNLPLTTGFHEVWLLDPDDLTRMVPLGSLPDRPGVVLPVPPGTDLNRYRLVDVSDEAHDGDAAHSGKSLLRGTLTS